MLSCASTSMPPAPHSGHPHPQPWISIMQPSPASVKTEPIEEGSFANDRSSFYSEGFQSASPSSSNKGSNNNSPGSVGSAGDPATFFNNISTNDLKAKANLAMHLESIRSGIPYSMLTPPGFDHQSSKFPSAHVSTPLVRADATPPKSPARSPSSPERDRERKTFEGFHDSGFDGNSNGTKDCDDANDGSGLEDFEDEPGFRVPAVNSHGKVKTFKCKQCEFVCVTKLEFWEHSRAHIKPEKMLCCKKCPFVTEYKHHLEYHMRNHSGSKPFSCDRCSYSCVNKSMLNSHLKSHSNIYQYRCADCNYATKYCHSLKLHLRKYQHKPAMVLNLDGTPNPLPIIDVYGTRRGPKQKPISKILEEHMMNTNNNNSRPIHPSHSLFANHFSQNLPYLPPILPHAFLFPPQNNYEATMSPKPSEAPLENRQSPVAMDHQPTFVERSNNSSPASIRSPISSPMRPHNTATETKLEGALDLTNTKNGENRTPPPVENPAPSTPTATKNRRKGPAFKLQTSMLRLQHEEERREEPSDAESEASTSTNTTVTQESFSCPHCEITFAHQAMHLIHMGFHGFNDPFMCNKCGERSTDRVAFFIHLGRAEHA